jgi:hypothetical protein
VGIEPWEDLPVLAIPELPISPEQVDRWRELIRLPPAEFQAAIPEQWRDDIANALGTALRYALFVEPTAAQLNLRLRDIERAARSGDTREVLRAVKTLKSPRRNSLDGNLGIVRAYLNCRVFGKVNPKRRDLKGDIRLLGQAYGLAPIAVRERLLRARSVMQKGGLQPADLAANASERLFFGLISLKDFALPGPDL